MSVWPPRRRMSATARAALVWPPVPPPAMTMRTGLSRPTSAAPTGRRARGRRSAPDIAARHHAARRGEERGGEAGGAAADARDGDLPGQRAPAAPRADLRRGDLPATVGRDAAGTDPRAGGDLGQRAAATRAAGHAARRPPSHSARHSGGLGAESEGGHGATRDRLGFGETRRPVGSYPLAGGAAGARIRGDAPVVVERHRAQEPDDEEREENGKEAEAGASHAGLSVVRARDQ